MLVVGAAHWDVIGRATGPVAPGDDLPGRVIRRPGGVAANIALALAPEMDVILAACIGADAEGDALRDALRAGGVSLASIPASPATDRYLAIEDGSGALVAAIADTGALDAGAAALVASANATPGPVVIDGNLPAGALVELRDASRLTLVPASPAKVARLAPLVARGAAILANRAEAEALTAIAGDSATLAAALVAMGARHALVTDGARPASLAMGGTLVTRTPPHVAAGGVTGAGDALAAGLLAALATGATPAQALDAALARAARHLQGTAS